MHFDVKLLPVLINPELNCIWINIPKNASSFMQKILQDNAWQEPDPSIHSSLINSNIRKLAILRNPVKRWISGFAECFMDMPEMVNMLDNPAFIEVVKRSPVFDNHTELQSTFVPDSRNLEYIYMDSDRKPQVFFSTVDTWLKNNGYQSDCYFWRDPVNPSSNDPVKKEINHILQNMQQNKHSLFDSLDTCYQSDYDLMNASKRINYEL